MENKKVFVDLDGVVADFVTAALNVHRVSPETILPKTLGKYCLIQELGLTPAKFWDRVAIKAMLENEKFIDDHSPNTEREMLELVKGKK